MDVGAFGESVRTYLHSSGHSQKELAHELSLNPKVLSRKLHRSENAYLTQVEVRRIILTLAHWKALTTQDETLHLLELAHMEPNSFSADEWQAPPLSELTSKHTQRNISSSSRTPTSTPTSPLLHNLPAPITQLIGREWAVDRLQKLLKRDEVRLVTLVGPGGSGKTRLAHHMASELVDLFAQGVWFVALAGVSDPTLVPTTLIQALNIQPTPGLPPLQSLTKHLRDKQLLLMLDNFEQVGAAASIVSELLSAAPGLKVLVTSRALLHLNGEHKFSVPPLDLPDPSVVPETARLLHYSAIQLFVERAQATEPDFVLTPENAASILQICIKVDGLPLALELAAARIKMLSPELLLERLLVARLSLLTGGARDLPSRQQTLHNTITWSYNLLSLNEQTWFSRLGVFSESWSFEAAEAMIQALAAQAPVALSPLDMLERLVDNSLLVRLPTHGQVRFTMLETLHAYALERLAAQEELERLRDWHASYYLRIAEAAASGLRGAQQLAWLAQLVAERDNFRTALEWSLRQARAGTSISSRAGSNREAKETARGGALSSEARPSTELPAVELCLRLAAALRPYWEWKGYLDEGRGWLAEALEIPLEEDASKTTLAARAKALSEAARLVCLQNEQIRAVELAEASITLWQQLNDPRGLATALFHRGWAAHAMGEYKLAQRVYEQALQLVSPTDEVWLHAQLLFYLGDVAGFTSDFEQMRSLHAQSQTLFEQTGDRSAIADLLKDQGGISILEGKYTEAIIGLVKSIELSHELGHKQFIATAMGLLGFAVGMRGQPEPDVASLQTAKLWGAADSLMGMIGFTSWLKAFPVAQEAYLQIRFRVDKERWKAAWVAGRNLTEAEAIALASSQRQGVLV